MQPLVLFATGALVAAAISQGGINISKERLFAFPSANERSSIQRLIPLGEGKGTLTIGTVTRPDPGQSDYFESWGSIGLLDPQGRFLYTRDTDYFPLDAVYAADSNSVWILAGSRTDSPAKVPVDFDLAPAYAYQQYYTALFLYRVRLEDGTTISVTRFPAVWSGASAPTKSTRMVADSRGGLWLGGIAAGPFPATLDAAERAEYFGRPGPGTLIHFSPKGDAIVYATHLLGDAVAALAIDELDNVFAVGDRIWKISPKGQMLWSTWIPPGAGLTAYYNERSGLFVGGCTTSLAPFPATPGAFQSTSADVNPRERYPPYYPKLCVDGFVARFTGDGGLVYATLVGGPQRDQVSSILADDDGNAIVLGTITEMPTTSRAIYTTWGNQFVAKLNPEGTGVSFLTNFLVSVVEPSNPIWSGNGSILLAGTEFWRDPNTDAVSLGLALVRVAVDDDGDDSGPRIDYLSTVVQFVGGPRTYEITLRGYGFATAGVAVLLDGRALPQGPAGPAGELTVRSFAAPNPSEDAYFLSDGTATYKLTVRNPDGSESPPVLVVLHPSPR